MLKKALKSGIGPGIGLTLGAVIVPRLRQPELYNETYPHLILHSLLYFLGGMIVCALVTLLIEWIRVKRE